MSKIDEQELLVTWARSADRMDEFVLVSDLHEAAAARSGADDVQLERARAAVLAGRPALAAGLLADVDRSVLTAKEHRWPDVVAMAAWAAQGDADALAALMRVGQTLDGNASLTHAYLLASAAEQVGEHKLADAVWRDVAAMTTPTMVVRRRTVVADVLDRSTTSADVAAGKIGGAARAVIDMIPMPEDGLAPTLDVVTRLEARGDRVGAWLVLEAIAALRPVADGVARLRAERATGGGWWRAHLPGLVAAAVATIIAIVSSLTGQPAWIPAIAAIIALVVWRRWTLGQGADVSRVDALVLADVRRLLPDVPTSFSLRSRRVGSAITGGAVVFLVSIVLVGLLVDGPLAALNRTDQAAVDAIVWPLILLATLIGGAASHRLLRKPLKAATRQFVDDLRAEATTGVSSCVCLRAVGMRGIETEAYLAHHLRPADADVVAALPTLEPATVEAYQCPLSQTPWLTVRLPEREALLFRGSLTRVSEQPDEPVGGGYL